MKKRIALLTDFGQRDYYVGVLKGVIGKIAPDTEVVDITHGIPPYSIMAGALALDKSYSFFSEGTVFLVVVDPGVGSSRRIIVAKKDGYTFVAPDNGVLTPVLATVSEPVKLIPDCPFFLTNDISTFEARDKMAPLSAALTMGADMESFAITCKDPVLLNDFFPVVEENYLKGKVLYADQFGNLISSVPQGMIRMSEGGEKCVAVKIGKHRISRWSKVYSEGGGEPFLIFGSHGNLEIAMNMASAADELGVQAGEDIIIEFSCRTV